MPDLYLPGAERVPGAQPGDTMVGGPPRCTPHITWDQLAPDGAQPSRLAVRDYLVRVNYEPHLMWDPFDGWICQFLPANRSAYALKHVGWPETNRMGAVNIQIEAFFTPGCVRDGKRYATLADTPLVGWDRIVEWVRSWGVPDVWPMGACSWTGNRSSAVWTSQAGWYGHSQVPNNDHTDPGPMPPFPSTPPPPPSEEDDMPQLLTAPGNAWFIRDSNGAMTSVPPGQDPKVLQKLCGGNPLTEVTVELLHAFLATSDKVLGGSAGR